MTNEEIKKYNKMCAFFVGYSIVENNERIELRNPQNVLMASYPCGFKETKEQTYNHVLELELKVGWRKFYSDWNMIMQVIDKIEDLGYLFNIMCFHPPSGVVLKWYSIGIMKNNLECLINNTYVVSYRSDLEKQETKKEAVVKAINQFLSKYYEY